MHEGNCSQVDRLWSILPVVYVTLYAWGDLRAAALLSMKDKRAGQPDGRVLLQWCDDDEIDGFCSSGKLLEKLENWLLRYATLLCFHIPASCHFVAHLLTYMRCLFVLCARLLVVLWGVRLTFNFWRKGGYSPTFEDYRWEHVRKLWPRPVFELFSLVFVSAAQVRDWLNWECKAQPVQPAQFGVSCCTPCGSMWRRTHWAL